MTAALLRRASVRIAAALLRRARHYGNRVFGPDEGDRHVATILEQVSRVDLRESVIVITGSSRGIGKALALAFSRAGARVIINGRDPTRVRAAVREIERSNGTALAVPADVATAEGARQLIEQAVAGYGRIDVLVNNAAVAGPVNTKPWDIDPEAWRSTIEANLNGPFLCAREAMRWMVANRVAGRIVNVSSGAARYGGFRTAPYVTSKFGLEGLTRALALDADGTGIVVCAVELLTVRTDAVRQTMNWEDFLRLPPPETAIPTFVHAITGPAQQVHGRVYGTWRFDQDAQAEAALANPLAGFPKFAFTPFKHEGRVLRRTDPGIRAFNRAENPVGMPKGVRTMLADGVVGFDLSHYPDETYSRLRQALSDRLRVPTGDFTFGAGSAELVERALRTFVGCGEEVVSNQPTWFMFDRFCAMADAVARKVDVIQPEPDGAFDHNLAAVAKAVGPRTRLVYLVNPSNPLGNGIPRAEFMSFLETIPPTLPIVVDEAYLEFSDNPETLRTHEIVRESDHCLIGLRTFSKFYGLAALRIGYAFGTAKAMRLFERLEHLFAISSIGEEAALAALEDEEHARATHELLRNEKARIKAELARVGLASVPSEIHIMLVECPVPAAEVDRVWGAFADSGVIIPRGVTLDRYIMLPVLQPEDNDRNLQILTSLRC
jgi:histidinol-phosphate aminotransferase